MLTLVLWQHVVFLCESYAVYSEPGYGCASYVVECETLISMSYDITVTALIRLLTSTLNFFVFLKRRYRLW